MQREPTRESHERSQTKMWKRAMTPVLTVTLICAWPRAAHAYLDPATGSMLLQVLLGGVAGAILVLRMFWQRILRFFGVRRQANDADTD